MIINPGQLKRQDELQHLLWSAQSPDWNIIKEKSEKQIPLVIVSKTAGDYSKAGSSMKSKTP